MKHIMIEFFKKGEKNDKLKLKKRERCCFGSGRLGRDRSSQSIPSVESISFGFGAEGATHCSLKLSVVSLSKKYCLSTICVMDR